MGKSEIVVRKKLKLKSVTEKARRHDNNNEDEDDDDGEAIEQACNELSLSGK